MHRSLRTQAGPDGVAERRKAYRLRQLRTLLFRGERLAVRAGQRAAHRQRAEGGLWELQLQRGQRLRVGQRHADAGAEK